MRVPGPGWGESQLRLGYCSASISASLIQERFMLRSNCFCEHTETPRAIFSSSLSCLPPPPPSPPPPVLCCEVVGGQRGKSRCRRI